MTPTLVADLTKHREDEPERSRGSNQKWFLKQNVGPFFTETF